GTALRGGAGEMVRPMMRAAREDRRSFARSDASAAFREAAGGPMTSEIMSAVRAFVAFRDSDRGRPSWRHALRVHLARVARSHLCDPSHALVCRRAVSVRGLATAGTRARKVREPGFSDHEKKLKPSLTLHKELVAP